MKRRLLNLLTAVSLLLCVAVVVLWARNWAVPGPAGEPAGWRATLQLKAPAARPPGEAVRAGDLVRYAIADLEGPGVITEKTQRVGRDGYVRLPFRRRLNVVGLTAEDIDSAISGAYPVHDCYGSYDRIHVTVATGDSRVPYLWVVLLLVLLPALKAATVVPILLRWRQTRRARAGLCVTCGYDVRATLDRCPECGHAPAGATG
jgi:hypothetical protein